MQNRDAIFDEIYKIMPEAYLLSADMGAWGIEKIKLDYPSRFINMGVAEQNTINVATGLALGGKSVFVYGIAAFIIFRCYDQIRMMSEMNLPVIIIGVGADMTYLTDGASHHAFNDRVLMPLTRNMTVYEPETPPETTTAIREGFKLKSPVYVRMVHP